MIDRWHPPRSTVKGNKVRVMTQPMDPRPSPRDKHETGEPARPVVRTSPDLASITRGTHAAMPEAAHGGDIQILELRGTIIRLREQLDRINADCEQRIREIESTHRAQRAHLEDTIRHLRDRLQTLTDTVNGG